MHDCFASVNAPKATALGLDWSKILKDFEDNAPQILIVAEDFLKSGFTTQWVSEVVQLLGSLVNGLRAKYGANIVSPTTIALILQILLPLLEQYGPAILKAILAEFGIPWPLPVPPAPVPVPTPVV